MLFRSCMKLVKTILLILFFFLLASWQYRILTLLLLVVVWRDAFRSVQRWLYPSALIVLLIGIYWTLPRYRYGSSDRVQLLYQDQEGQVVHPPLSHYLVNALIPEEEAMNVCIYGVRCVGKLPQLSNWLVDDFKKDDKQGKVSNFYSPINSLNRSGEFPMSGNGIGMQE